MIIIQIVRVLNVLCVYVLCRTWKEFESSSIGSKVDCIHILCYLLCNHFFFLFFPLSSALFYNHHVISKGGKRVWSGIFRTYFHNHFCLFSFIKFLNGVKMETISPISTPQIALFFGFYTPIDFPLKTSLIQSLFRLHTVKLHFRNKREDETTSRDILVFQNLP